MMARSKESTPSPSIPMGTGDVLDHETLQLIQKTIRSVGRRLQMSAVETEDFAGVVWLKLLDRDYRVLRRHKNRSSLATFLFAVILNAGRDYRNACWGKWRPSAAALRLGDLAVRLEQLNHRDGYSEEEAAILVSNENPGASLEDMRELQALLPQRTKRRSVGTSALVAVGTSGGVEAKLRASRYRDASSRVREALRASLLALDTVERRMVEERFSKGRKFSEIARDLGIEQSQIYRKAKSCLAKLKLALRGHGVDTQDVKDVVGRTDDALSVFQSK